MKLTTTILALASTVAIASQAQAVNVRVFNNRTDYVNALNGHEFEGFNDPNTEFTFSGGGFRDISNGRLNARLTNNNPMNINFNRIGQELIAFGGKFDLSPGGAGMGIDIFFNNGENFALSVPRETTNGFFGFIADESFTNLTFNAGQENGAAETFNMDYLKFKAVEPTVEAVPEPLTIIGTLLAGGFAIVAKRRQNMLESE